MIVRAASFVLSSALAAAPLAFAAETTATPGTLETWSSGGCEIWEPEFSPDSSILAFTIRDRGGGILASPCTGGSAQSRRELDPRIAVLNLRSRKLQELGYGRHPAFSPSGRSLVFSGQTNPTTFARSETLDHLWDNHIAIHDFDSRKTRVIAKPEHGYLTAPSFSPDGARVTFLEISGHVSNLRTTIRQWDLKHRGLRTLYDATRIGERFISLRQYGYFDGRLLARLAVPKDTKPADPETGFLEQIAEIRDGAAISLFQFGDQSSGQRSMNRLRTIGTGGMIFDGRWRRFIDPTNPGPPLGPGFEPHEDDPGTPSRDGRWIARAVSHMDGNSLRFDAVVVEDLDTGKRVARFPVDSRKGVRPDTLTWSRDSRRLAWTDFATGNFGPQDTLYIATMP